MSKELSRLAEALRLESPTPLCASPKPRYPTGHNYPIWRLREAWTADNQFGSDEAVLVRQVIRWAGGRILAPALSENVRARLAQAGVLSDECGILNAFPYRPEWACTRGTVPPDGIDAPPVIRVPDESVPSEFYVGESFGYQQWKSQALKEACWQVYQAPAGSVQLVALPTGSGKSLCFHFLARFSNGLTLVIVPTVALAIDQYRAACNIPGLSHLGARYFAADDPYFNPQEVADSVRSGSTRLLFASPEACVSGRLRKVLDEVASQGRLDHVVIDEAHMVGTWGIFFRVDFQLLSSIWRQWRERSGYTLRTLLLSATFTPECRDGLRSLFSEEPWLEFISQRLRPEISYYLAQFESESNREDAVVECAWRVSRPAILYTTCVLDAVSWRQRLVSEGFRRVECFTGETSRSERRRLLDCWRNDQIDFMVATSAFGLGVDKPDVRTVIHACLPEDLDRFYQEVGRTGRDGYSSVSVLLATSKDFQVARGLGPRLLRPETIQERWESLWSTREVVDQDNHLYRVAVQAKKTRLTGTRTYEENVRWNKRLLLQLLRAGRLNLTDLEYRDGEDETEWATIQLAFPPHSPDIASLIAPVRRYELGLIQRGLERMITCLNGDERLCSVLCRLYGKGTIPSCGGCPVCRKQGRVPLLPRALTIPASTSTDAVVEAVLGLPTVAIHADLRPVTRWLRRARQSKGIRRYVVDDASHAIMLAACREAFGGDPMPYRVDALGADGPDWEIPFYVHPDEDLLILHTSFVHRGVWQSRWGRKMAHWICDGCIPHDDRGKSWLVQPGVRPFVSPEAWIDAGD